VETPGQVRDRGRTQCNGVSAGSTDDIGIDLATERNFIFADITRILLARLFFEDRIKLSTIMKRLTCRKFRIFSGRGWICPSLRIEALG
jgi:hypothetical protein